jgi:hypothetical protein
MYVHVWGIVVHMLLREGAWTVCHAGTHLRPSVQPSCACATNTVLAIKSARVASAGPDVKLRAIACVLLICTE